MIPQPALGPGPAPVASSDGAVLLEFRRQIDAALDAAVPPGSPVALLHFPYDPNVGNHLMWVALDEYLASRGCSVRYVAHARNLDLAALRRAIGGGPILFLGGVTISRLWPWHGEAKRRIAEAFPDNPLVSLPATILLVDEQDRRQAATLFGRHARTTVMARDAVSAGQARQAFPPEVRVVTVPDLALRLAPQPFRPRSVRPVLWLVRGDQEGRGARPPADAWVEDWPEFLSGMPAVARWLRLSSACSRVRRSPAGRPLGRPLNAAMAACYARASRAALAFGNRFMDRARVVVTDRFHPHVLAALRGQQVVLLPDRYGKNRAIYEAGTQRLSTVHWADDPSDAAELALTLARSP